MVSLFSLRLFGNGPLIISILVIATLVSRITVAITSGDTVAIVDILAVITVVAVDTKRFA